jgi:ATP-dependent Clp protease, protease subunit
MHINDLIRPWKMGAEAGYGASGQIYPGIIERVTQEKRIIELDVRAKLIEERIIFLGDPIYPQTANVVVCQMLHLESLNKELDIQLFINSPGGDVQAGLAIYDAMQYIACDVKTICVGLAASMGAVLLAAGTSGKRFCLPNARVMVHQPWTSGIGGTVSDVMISATELQKTKQRINGILAHHCGKSIQDMDAATDRDKWMSAPEAKEFGVVDDLAGVPIAVPTV